MIFISFIYLFIYPARFVALIPWAGGYFHLMNALYFSFVREVTKLFSSKLSHWRWWFSWGEQTQTTLWLFIILAGSRGSKPKANDTTRRKNVLCHIYASWILMSIFSLFRNAFAFKDAETRRTLPKRELMALGTLWPAPCHAKPRNESKRIHFPQQFSAPQSLPLIRQNVPSGGNERGSALAVFAFRPAPESLISSEPALQLLCTLKLSSPEIMEIQSTLKTHTGRLIGCWL